MQHSRSKNIASSFFMTFEKTFLNWFRAAAIFFNGQSFHRAQNDLSFFSQNPKILGLGGVFLILVDNFFCVFRVIDFLRPRSDNRTKKQASNNEPFIKNY